MLGDTIKKLRNSRSMKQSELAHILGISSSTVGMYETNKRTPDVETLDSIAKHFNVTVDYLLGREQNSATLKIPVFGYIPAGIPLEAIENIIDYEEAPADWAAGGQQYFALQIKGHSMEPAYQDKDVIIFRAQPDCENNEDCAVAINGNDWTFKRVEKKENGILVKPLNPAYDAMFFTNEECISLPVEIKGIFWELRRGRSKK